MQALFLTSLAGGKQFMVNGDFDVDSLARYLCLSPGQVKKMADRGKLPGRRIGGRWKFAAAEIHHWIESKIGTADEIELGKVEQVLDSSKVKVNELVFAELLTVESVFLGLPARTKRSVIEKMCEFSADFGKLWEPKAMAEAIRRREEIHPTALESGVALLHPRRPQPGLFGDSFIALGITSSGIPFGGPRGCLTDLFFLIASANDAIHLKILARLSRLIQIDGLLENIRSASSPEQIWQMLVDAEFGL